MIALDTEYSDVGVLYGFLDLSSDEFKQFWFDEKDKAIEYLSKKKDYLFIHWGGADKKLLKEELNCDARTLNMLYYVQTSLVAPISSAGLRDVYDTLCGHREDKLWEKSFYGIDGLYKLMLCNRILADPNNMSAREELAEANKVDILALKEIVEKLRRLPPPKRLHN